MNIGTGDIIIIERRDSGRRYLAMVDWITKGNRVHIKAAKCGSSEWAKARGVDIRNENIIGKAPDEDAARWIETMETRA